MQTPLEPAIAIVGGSTKNQVATVSEQEHIVRDYADVKGFDMRGVFEDSCKSAEKIPFLKREVVATALTYCREHRIRHIIIPNIDRAFRDAEDCRETIRILSYGESSVDLFGINLSGITGTAIHVVESGIDSRDELCLLILTIRAKCAAEATRKRSERHKEAHKALRETGQQNCGPVPYGWNDPNPADTPKAQRIPFIPNSREQAVLARLVHGDLSALSANEAARQLNAGDIPSPGAGNAYARTDPHTHKVKKWVCNGKWKGPSINSVRKHARLAEDQKGRAEEGPKAGNAKANRRTQRTDSAQQETATPSYAQIHCPACSKILRLTLPLQGRLWNCPNCRTRFSVAFDAAGHMATHIKLPSVEASLHRPWYEVLEVSRSASVAEIKTAFRDAMRKNHPDKVAAMSHDFAKLADRKAKEINRAYEEALKKRNYI